MSQYTVDDFTESMARTAISPHQASNVVAAWGENGDYAEWTGGFLLLMTDGRYAVVSGWCDTTGWGCQDGVSVDYHGSRPAYELTFNPDGFRGAVDVDESPNDLRRCVEHCTAVGSWGGDS